MKKIVIILLLTVLLTGCSKEKEYVYLEETEYMALIDELYNGFEDLYKTCEELCEDDKSVDPFGVCDEEDQGISSNIVGDYVLQYDNFEKMRNSETSSFVYGRVVDERETGCLGKSYFIQVFESGFSDERSIIRVSGLYSERFISVGGIYVLNLGYSDEYDNYNLTQGNDSVFRVLSGKIGIPSIYATELEDKREINVFLDYILD